MQRVWSTYVEYVRLLSSHHLSEARVGVAVKPEQLREYRFRRPSRHFTAAAEGNHFSAGGGKPLGMVLADTAGTGDGDAQGSTHGWVVEAETKFP